MIDKVVKKTLRATKSLGKGVGKGLGKGLGKGVKKLRSGTKSLKKTLKRNVRKNRKFLKLGGKKNAKKTGGMPAEYFGAPMNKSRTENAKLTTALPLPKNTVNNNFVSAK
tara:strand:- start:8038 stop:8367 length:330 start_codon:yes stop_codon:yes gene_type:complete